MPIRRIASAGSLAGLLLLASCAGAPVAYSPTGAPIPAASYGVGAPVASGYGTPNAPAPYGYMCFAGAYQCQLSAQVPVGSQCSCPGLGAPSFGVVR